MSRVTKAVLEALADVVVSFREMNGDHDADKLTVLMGMELEKMNELFDADRWKAACQYSLEESNE